MKYILALLLLLLIPVVSASITYDISSEQFENSTIYSIDNNKINKIYKNLEEISDNWDYDKLLLDQQNTKGFDFIIKQQNNYLTFEDIGTLQGIVTDNLGNVIPYTELSFECLNPTFHNINQTNKFGSFTVHLPKGNCKVIAMHEERVATINLEINKGDLKHIEIKLNLIQDIENNTSAFFFIGIPVILILIFIVSFMKKNKESLDKEEKKEKTLETSIEAIEKVMNTLNYREQEIVKALQEKGTLNQSDVKAITGLPKSSLSRILKKLYMKNIIDIVENGNIKKISLRPDFKA